MRTEGDFEAVRKDIVNLLRQPEYDDGSAGPVFVRLAWQRYEAEGGDPANAGLQHARVFLEPVKEKHSWITYADLWTLAGVVAIKEMGGPDIPWKGGRTDYVDDSKLPPRGRLPDGAQGSDHLRWIFYRMGFNDREIVALSRAHNLGRCHSDRSGFEGAWVNNPTRFSNQYYRLLLSLQWRKKKLPNGIEQFMNYDDDTGTELMMLPTDIALTQDPKFRPWVSKYADDKDAFFEDFSKVFAKLIELGIDKDDKGRITNADNEKGGYHAAPKKDTAGVPAKSTDDGVDGNEAEMLKEENNKFRARL